MAKLPNLPLIQERFFNSIKNDLVSNKIKYPSFEIIGVFLQTWGSTALGFSGCGGQSMTSEYTTVIRNYDLGYAAVFFGEVMAYIVQRPNDIFWADAQSGRMCAVRNSHRYEDVKMDEEDD